MSYRRESITLTLEHIFLLFLKVNYNKALRCVIKKGRLDDKNQKAINRTWT